MARAHQSEFRFRTTDTIGAASAEDDTEFLKTCFVETEEYELLKNRTNIRQIVLGRTGSGKSALFERLKQEEKERVISIEPHNLALTHVSNSSVIRFFSDLGVNLDPFYKLLWRHVLIVEVLKKHFEHRANIEKGKMWDFLTEMFTNQTQRDKNAKEAVRYLQKWGEKFWEETEYRVKEITSKLEKDVKDQLGLELGKSLFKAKVSSNAKSHLSEEERAEVVNRGQHVVSQTQVQDLNHVIGLLEHVLSDRQKYYYVLIDRLDENWIEEKLRYRLIMALMDSVREISKVTNVKVLVAIRRDLIERVFTLVRGAGFQEEKYQSLYLPLRWSPSRIIDLLDRRVDALVARRYQKARKVTHRDLLPQKIDKIPIKDFISARAQRPRDVISFFNKCIEAADGKTRLNVDILKHAEGEYSRHRLRALADEWHADYPGLLDFTDVLKKLPKSFSLSQVGYEDIANLCLKSAIEHPEEHGILREMARKVAHSLVPVEDFKRMLFMVFYRVGLIGLKLETFESTSWVDEVGGQGVSPSEIDDSTRVVVHTTYQRALGIKTVKQK